MIETRASNANKHPGLAVIADTKPRRSSKEVAIEREVKAAAKEARKTAKLYADVLKAERLDRVTTNVTAEDTSYATPVVSRAPAKRKAPPLQRTESVLDLQPELNATNSMSMLPPPLPAAKQVKKNGAPAKTASTPAAKPKSARAGVEASIQHAEGARTSAPTQPKVQPAKGARTTASTKPKKHDVGDADTAPAQTLVKDRPKPVRILPAKAPDSTDNVEMVPADTIPDRATKYYGHPPANNMLPPHPQPIKKTHRAPPSKATASSERAGVGAPGPSRSKAPAVVIEDDSVTEDDSQAPEPHGVGDDVATEDDSPAFLPLHDESSETEFSNSQPKKKQKSQQAPVKRKAAGKHVVQDGKKQAIDMIREDSSEVEIVAESKKKKSAKKQVKESVIAPALPPHQKAYRDKMQTGPVDRYVLLPYWDSHLVDLLLCHFLPLIKRHCFIGTSATRT